MDKVILDIKVNGLHDEYLRHASCYLLIGERYFAYMLTDASNRVLAVKSVELSSSKNGAHTAAHTSDPLLQTSFAECTIGIYNGYYGLVPNRMFDPAQLPSYLKLLARFEQEPTYAFDDPGAVDAKLVYAIEPEVNAYIAQHWPQARVLHHTTALLESYRSYCNTSTYNVFANIAGHDMQIFVFDGTEILFCNTFTFSSTSDFVYFLLLPLKQLGIEPTQTSIVISGEIAEDSDYLTLARRFIGPFRFMQLPRVLEYPGAIRSLPSHFCFDLYSLKLKK